jgi:AcrR family transcriptional regulator
VTVAAPDSIPADVHADVMSATGEALRECGYAGLTMQEIADRAEKSKSLLHYHYDTKEGLLVAFLEHLVRRFDAKLDGTADAPPDERLADLIDLLLPDEDDEDWARLHRVLIELRAQAPHQEAFREQLNRNKAFLQRRLAETIEDGVEDGTFREVDPDRTARFVLSALDGARSARTTLGDADDVEAVRAGLAEFVLADLRRSGEGTERVDPAAGDDD